MSLLPNVAARYILCENCLIVASDESKYLADCHEHNAGGKVAAHGRMRCASGVPAAGHAVTSAAISAMMLFFHVRARSEEEEETK